MYQGKFLAENRAAKASASPKKAEPAVKDEEILKDAQFPAAEQEAPVAVKEEISAEVNPVPEKKEAKPSKAKKEKKKKKGIRIGTVIFYLLYLMLIGAAAYGINYVYNLLNDWLTVYEASQPDTRNREIFDEHFSDPDWGWVYDQAGLQGTEFEGKEAYITYMENLVGDTQLTYSKTSAGLSGGQKYIVKLGEQKVATFTMQNPVTDELEIPQWSLSSIEAGFFTRNEDVTILTQPGRTITLNGVPLDETYVTKTTSSVVDSYLPEGIHGPRTATLYAKGFLVAPEVLVIDEAGELVPMEYNAETNTYFESTLADHTDAEISKEEYDAIVNATLAYCKHMIGATGANLKNFFDTKSDIYKTINKNELWFKGYARYDFSEETVTEYRRYSDELFSARIQISLNTYRNDGSLKAFPVNTTFFLQKDSNGQWRVNNMTNVDIRKQTASVRLTFKAGDNVLFTNIFPEDVDSISAPMVTAPEGKVFDGWYRQDVAEDGSIQYTLVFAPDETGIINLPAGTKLEPMILYALFVDAQ